MLVNITHPIRPDQLQFWLSSRRKLVSERRLNNVVVSASPYVGVVLRARGNQVEVEGTFPSVKGILLFVLTLGLAWLWYGGKQDAFAQEITAALKSDFGTKGNKRRT